MKIQKVEPLYQQAYNILRNEILQGSYSPGEKIFESRVATKLGVSRGPVREAMSRLAQEGLIVSINNYYHVIEYTQQDVVDVYQCRKALESMAAALAAENITEKELLQLKDALEKSEEAVRQNDFKEIVKNNTLFHNIIVMCSRNSSLIDLLTQLSGKTAFFRITLISKYQKNDFNENYMREHREIFKEILDKNPLGSKLAMENHIESDIVAFTKFMSSEGEDNLKNA